jgi:two-component system response regulator
MSDNLVEILLVEDNPFDVEATLNALARHNLGNAVKVVRDGEEALEFLFCAGVYADRRIDNIPGVVLLDLKLPKVDGLGVLRRMKADPRTRKIPVVLLTTSQNERHIAEAYQLGVNSYVVKPTDFEQFCEVMRQVGMYWVLVNEPSRL